MDGLAVLGSKARLKTLRALTYGDRYLSELMEAVGMDGKTAAHHLDVLEEAGLVASYRRGRRRYFTLVRGVELTIRGSPNRRFMVQFPRSGGSGEAPASQEQDEGEREAS
ncbi:MAG: winged helix-turn-helix domain-containing protein [Candidatus Thermoplasmatota archaeon]|nr:winged helix-turn-helix domain-containing protein [Candidatus Thermoplasmatota archaeon]